MSTGNTPPASFRQAAGGIIAMETQPDQRTSHRHANPQPGEATETRTAPVQQIIVPITCRMDEAVQAGRVVVMDEGEILTDGLRDISA